MHEVDKVASIDNAEHVIETTGDKWHGVQLSSHAFVFARAVLLTTHCEFQLNFSERKQVPLVGFGRDK